MTYNYYEGLMTCQNFCVAQMVECDLL